MNNSIISASVSLSSLQQKLDMLSTNIANVNTMGYKRKDVSFEDVLTNIKSQPQGFKQTGRMSPLGFNQGWGVRATQVTNDMHQGALQATQNELDFAIQGDGMFEVSTGGVDANGQPEQAWTRNGAFQLSQTKGGELALTTKEGRFVLGADGKPILIPTGMKPNVDANGRITAVGHDGTPVEIGQLKIVRIFRPQLLSEVGENLYKLPANITQTSVLQDVTPETATGANRVSVMQGYLEQSNVNLSDEMTDLITVQRAFQLSSRAITSSDTMMGLANNLRS